MTTAGAAGDLRELRRGERADLGLRLRDREVERKRRRLARAELLAEELVPDLRAVPVRDDDRPGAEDLGERGERVREVRALLGRGSALALAQERVAAERDDGESRGGHAPRFRTGARLPAAAAT